MGNFDANRKTHPFMSKILKAIVLLLSTYERELLALVATI